MSGQSAIGTPPPTVNTPENDAQEIVAEVPVSDEAQALCDYIKGNRNVNTNKKTDQVNANFLNIFAIIIMYTIFSTTKYFAFAYG